MTDKEVARLLDCDGWIEYCSDLYEYIGEDDLGRHIFSDVNDGTAIYISDKALRNSTEFYFTEKF